MLKTYKIGKGKYSLVDIAFNTFNYLGFALFTMVCMYPFYYLIINTISANNLSANGFINFWPQQIHFENYVQILKLKGLPGATMISILRTLIGTFLTVLASGFLGFMFTQDRMWARRFWYRFLVVTMYFNAGLIPMYLTMRNIGISNTFWVYVIPVIVQPL